MATQFAFVGFRHPHVRDMFTRCMERDDVEVVACCEPDEATRAELAKEGVVEITHASFQQMLEETQCEVVATGAVYAHRANFVEQALAAGRHVISDKPLCVSLDELDRIEALAANHDRKVGVMLDMRDHPIFLGLRKLIQDGAIGEVRSLSFDGQHPLLRGKRPNWYFEKGMHGGTLNDIAVHAIDLIPWATGLAIAKIHAARCWSARTPDAPHFEECGQAMLELSNGAGLVCDVSYLTPDSFAYQFPHYWRFCVWGDLGAIVTSLNDDCLSVYREGDTNVQSVAPPAGRPGGYLDSFLREIRGETDLHLSCADAIASSRTCLQIQHAADQGKAHVSLP